MRWYLKVWYAIGKCEDEKILDEGLEVKPSGWDDGPKWK